MGFIGIRDELQGFDHRVPIFDWYTDNVVELPTHTVTAARRIFLVHIRGNAEIKPDTVNDHIRATTENSTDRFRSILRAMSMKIVNFQHIDSKFKLHNFCLV